MKCKYVCLLTAHNYISHSYCAVRAFKCFFAYLVNSIRYTYLQIMLRSKTHLSILYEYLLAIQFHDTQQHCISHSEHLATQQTKFLQFWAYWRLETGLHRTFSNTHYLLDLHVDSVPWSQNIAYRVFSPIIQDLLSLKNCTLWLRAALSHF